VIDELIYRWRITTATLRRLPDFIIIGAQKGGTSSLFSYLNQHPELTLSFVKEVHFFDVNYSHGIKWYKSHFPFKFIHPNFKTGEASPYYLFHPLAAQRVYRHCPFVKIIVLLRNPVDRAYSHYIMQHKKQIEPLPTFEEAIQTEDERLSGEIEKIRNDPQYFSFNHQHYSYLMRGLYFQQISEWLKIFPYNRFLFLRSEDFFNNTQNELQKVYNFLEIPLFIPPDLNPENTNSYPPMEENTRRILEQYYADENKKLACLLGNQFLWEKVA
jgi:hypothetical protein